MIKRNFHTHTSRCGHAVGSDEEYVINAVKAGIRVLGFSDHAAYPQPLPTDRMNIEQVPDYFTSIRSLKEKYKDQIEIHVGMEVECYQDQWDTLKKWREMTEYCILGQHEITFAGKSAYDIKTPEELNAYTDQLAYACEHNLCDYIAHPDVCMWSYPRIDESVKTVAERIADLSLKYDMPLEINTGSGVRYGRQKYEDGLRYAYPVRIFLETFARKHCKMIFGLDVHDPAWFLTDEYLNRCYEVMEGLDLNLIEDYDLIGEAARRKKNFY